MFCKNCGKQLPDNVQFCNACGTRVSSNVRVAAPAPAQQMNNMAPAPAQQMNNMAPAPAQQMNNAAPAPAPNNIPLMNSAIPIPPPGIPYGGIPQNAAALTYRVTCPSCGTAQDASFQYTCKKCGANHQVDTVNNGFLQIYRMGHFQGSMAKQAIYLNGEKAGTVANTGSILFELRPGTYNVHAAITGLRNCEDIQVNIYPGSTIYVKSQLKVGALKNKLLLHVVDSSEMPTL